MASETEDLNDSWVELHFNKNNMADTSNDSSTDVQTDLLADAQADTQTDSRTHSQTHSLADLLTQPDNQADWQRTVDTPQTEPQVCLYSGPSLMEKLLMDAQRESRNPSCAQSREQSCNVSRVQSRDPSTNVSRTTSRPHSKASSLGGSSPKSPPSPTSSPHPEWSAEWRSREPGTEWIWDWSSRPEIVQSFENIEDRFRHPMKKKRPILSMRNSDILRKSSIFSWANLPTLLFTHAASFFFGAAVVIIYVKKYCSLPAITPASLPALD